MRKNQVFKGNSQWCKPLAYKLPLYEKLTFDTIRNVYQKMIKNRNYAIGIVGKVSDMDIDKLETHGKIIKVNKNNLFSEEYKY